jgi:hypothetical protein
MYSTPNSLDGFLDEVREGILARRHMEQDILRLLPGCERREFNELATPSEEHSDTDMWSPTQSTTTMGLMTPTEYGCNGDDELAVDYDEDKALEQILRAAGGVFTQKDLARLAFHWTNIGVFGEFERQELTNPF